MPAVFYSKKKLQEYICWQRRRKWYNLLIDSILSVEQNANNVLTIYDPQSNESFSGKAVSKYLKNIKYAQYGRMYYEENDDVLKMLKELFVDTTAQIDSIISKL